MPSHPTLFDDESDDAPGPDRPGGRTVADDGGSRFEPNYLLRRALFVGAVVALIAVAAIVVGRLIGGSGDGDRSGAASADWNHVVTVDPRTGRLLVYDDAGEQVARIDPELTGVAASAVVGPTAVVAASSGVAVVDLATETVTVIDLSAASVVMPTGSTHTVIATDAAGQQGVLVHGPTGDVIDTAETAPVAGARYEFATARSDPSGRHVLVTDTGNFQSVLFSFDRDEPSYFPGLALAVSDELVVTAQNVGNAATVSVFDHAGDARSSGRMASVRAAIIADDVIRLVTVEGDVMSMKAGADDVAAGAELDIGTVVMGTVVPNGDHLVVTGSAGTAIVAADGKVVATVPDHVAPLDPDAARGDTCIDLASADAAGTVVLVALDDGDVDDDLGASGDIAARSADGCTLVLSQTTGYTLVTRDSDPVTVDDDVLVALAPNASRTVVERGTRLALTDPRDPNAEAVNIGARGRTVWFVDL